MTALVGGDGLSLSQKCLDFCQALERQGRTFSFNLNLGPSFSFSLDTREKENTTNTMVKKKASPSSLRRNARRKEEFLKRKTPVNIGASEKEAVKEASENEALKEDSVKEAVKEASENKAGWSSELIDKGSDKSVTIKLKKKPPNIPQFDGQMDEVTKDAEVQVPEVKPETNTKSTQTISTAPVLEICQVQQTNIPAVPSQPPRSNMGPYPSNRAPRSNMGPYMPPHSR